MKFALSEITLVLFTSLAPSGAVAYAILGLLAIRHKENSADLRSLSISMGVPLAVCLVGLIASATHLGNPANALYVFSRVGESPLSNEIAAAVIFFATAGFSWLYGFAERLSWQLQRIFLIISVLLSAIFIMSIAFAYNADTIVSWSTGFVPISLVLSGFVGGPLLAFACLCGFCSCCLTERLRRNLALLSFAGVVFGVAILLLQGAAISALENSTTSIAELSPHYNLVVLLYAALASLGQYFVLHAEKTNETDARYQIVLGLFLVFCGTFVIRFLFYTTHMTFGL